MKGYFVPTHTVLREMDGKAIALNLDTGQYYTLNEMGTRMWALLQEMDATADVVAAIEAEYEVTREEVERDLEAFLADLQNSGLIKRVPSSQI